MPIEIKELIIRAHIRDDTTSGGGGSMSMEEKKQLAKEVAGMVMDQLKAERER